MESCLHTEFLTLDTFNKSELPATSCPGNCIRVVFCNTKHAKRMVLSSKWISQNGSCLTFNFTESLEGKNVLLTGASRGIGEQMAYVYARAGANLFITARSEDRLQKVKGFQHSRHI